MPTIMNGSMTSPTKAKHRLSASSSRAQLLVVEDHQDLQELLVHNLTREGYGVATASSAEEALKQVRSQPPDLIVLDLMLPGIDGLDFCRICKSDPGTAGIAIIFLTAKTEEADIVSGLELGADDYVVKPFRPRVLMARIKAVLRRPQDKQSPDQAAVIQVGALTVDPGRFEARVGGDPVALTRTEYRILQLLARRPGRVFTRSQIVQGVQGDNVVVTDRSVDVHIVSLRRKLGDTANIIKTIRGVGYRLEE